MSTILFVEDDDAVRAVVSEALALAGHRVVAIASGLEAGHKLDALLRQIDLAIFDVKMPQGNPHGFALARMARWRRRELPVVFLTGYPDVIDIEGEPPGPVLVKPVRMAELLDTVQRLLDQQLTPDFG